MRESSRQWYRAITRAYMHAKISQICVCMNACFREGYREQNEFPYSIMWTVSATIKHVFFGIVQTMAETSSSCSSNIICLSFVENFSGIFLDSLWCLVDTLMKRSDIIQGRGRIYGDIRKLYKKIWRWYEEKKMKAINIVYIKLLHIKRIFNIKFLINVFEKDLWSV